MKYLRIGAKIRILERLVIGERYSGSMRLSREYNQSTYDRAMRYLAREFPSCFTYELRTNKTKHWAIKNEHKPYFRELIKKERARVYAHNKRVDEWNT